MSAVSVTILTTTIGFIVGGAVGCVGGPCGSCIGAPIGGAIGFVIPVVGFSVAAIAQGVFTMIGKTFEGGVNLLSLAVNGTVSAVINHPYVSLITVIALVIIMNARRRHHAFH